ncbi:MAG: phosphoribosylanthranilate isomerase [Bacteroidota bacterium]
MSKRPRIKICCISSVEEANMAIKAGADALGLVSNMPSGPGVISEQLIKDIASHTPPPIGSFLLTSETTAPSIIEQHQKVQTNTIQLVDAIPIDHYALLRKGIPTVKLVQVIHVMDEKSIEEAMEVAPHVDALLLDSGNPNAAVKVLGGTGKTHNWVVSRKIVESVSIPVFLAGGLNENNVQKALDEVNPYGLDLCSSVRTDGKLDADKLERFFSSAMGHYS